MANHPRNTPCPAVAELVLALQSVIPELRGAGIGTIRNDGSRHTAGLAMDIMLDSTDAYEKGIADDIIAALIDMQGQIGWHDILYTDWPDDNPTVPFHFQIPGPGGEYAGHALQKNPNHDLALGRAHENHIHVDWVDFSLRIVPHETAFVYDWPQDALSMGFTPGITDRLALSSRQ